MTIIKFIKNLYHTFLPISVRESPIVVKLKSKLVAHDWRYSTDYYEDTVEGPSVRSAETIANSIVNDLEVKSIIDVGCGTGALLEALRNRG